LKLVAGTCYNMAAVLNVVQFSVEALMEPSVRGPIDRMNGCRYGPECEAIGAGRPRFAAKPPDKLSPRARREGSRYEEVEWVCCPGPGEKVRPPSGISFPWWAVVIPFIGQRDVAPSQVRPHNWAGLNPLFAAGAVV